MIYAVIRVRGSVNVKSDIKDTLKMLRLNSINHCVLLPKTESYSGMLQKVKDYITWGEIAPQILAKMIIHRGRLIGDKKISDKYIKANTKYKSIMSLAKAIAEGETSYQEIKDIKPVIRLHPPRKGYRGVKKSYKLGGALGYRGEDINKLIDKMI